MRAVVQRVSSASVDVAGERVAEIGPGLLVLVGATHEDGDAEAQLLASKIANLRVFSDAAGKMNRSALDCGHEAIVVSQFTLYGDVRKGRRPSFVAAAPPEIASRLIEDMVAALRAFGMRVTTGRFGADMAVSLVNDGPVTIWLDTAEWRGPSRRVTSEIVT